jgi:calmodulin
VTVADASDYADTFQLIDANSDGLISAAELRQLMDALGDEITDDAAEQAVRIIDSDGDGLISLEEFAGYLSGRAPDGTR